MGRWQRRTKYLAYLGSDAWARRRRMALTRAGQQCEWVARTGRRCSCATGLEVHHKTYVRFGNEHPDDLQVLCARHHAIADRRRVQAREQAARRRQKRRTTL